MKLTVIDNEGFNEVLSDLKASRSAQLSMTESFMRDMANKVIHGAGFEWQLENAVLALPAFASMLAVQPDLRGEIAQNDRAKE